MFNSFVLLTQTTERSTKILDGSAATTADLSEIEQIVKERMVSLCTTSETCRDLVSRIKLYIPLLSTGATHGESREAQSHANP